MANASESTPSKFSKDLVDNSSEIKLRRLIENRASEIAMTIRDVKRKLPKLSAQQVPRHMRRRSVSHNVKRLPQRVQERANKEVKIAKKSKRPSRKYRRRPSNLLEEYGRRQQPGKATWLETHVWLAKRFHMTSRWGYKLPLTSNDKGARASYRAASNFCLLHDLSYFGCIELLGPQDVLLQGLQQLCSPETGLTFAAKTYLPGSREGCLVLYHANSYPYKAIGPVSFLWKPKPPDKDFGSHDRQMWIWTHPACYKEAAAAIGTVFGISIPNLDISLSGPSECLDLLATKGAESGMTTDLNVSNKKELINDLNPLSTNKKSYPTVDETDKINSIIQHSIPTSSLNVVSTDEVIMKVEDVEIKPDINGNLSLEDVNIENVGKVSTITKRSELQSPEKLSGIKKDVNVKNVGQVSTITKKSEMKSPEKLSGIKSCLKRKAKEETHKQTKIVKLDKSDSETPTHQKSFKNGTITIHLLKDQLVRFRLTGPRSHAVLQETLQMASVVAESGGNFWWHEYYRGAEGMQELLSTQRKVWEEQAGLASAACLSPGYALALTVRDPRVIALPKSKVNALPSLNHVPQSASQPPPPASSLGPIWDQNALKSVREAKTSQAELNRLKSLLFIPGSDLELHDKENRVPVLLIQNVAHGFSGSNCGWDLILPSSWGMPFWISLIYRGCRVSPLEELYRSCVDQEIPLFPDHYDDSHSGAEYRECHRKELMTKHFRYPPDKRPNFVLLGIASPFSPPWKDLVSEWKSAKCEHFYVLRNKRVLRQLGDGLATGRLSEASLRQEKFDDALVFVSVECLFKGVLSEFAHLCLPETEDFFQLKYINSPGGPTEKLHRRTKGTLKEKQKTKKAQEYVETTPVVEGLMNLGSRKPIGYLKEGRFSFLKAKGAGIGFVAYKALLLLAAVCFENKRKLTVLVRAQNSNQYRFAQLKIVV